MADVGIIQGEKLLIKIGDGASPENFVHPCLINTTRGINFTTNVTETEVADCADQSLPAKIVRKAKSIDISITGAGKVDKASVFAYIQWWESALPKNAKVGTVGESGAEGGWTGTGQLILKEFNIKGDRGDYQDVDISFVPADTFEWEQNDYRMLTRQFGRDEHKFVLKTPGWRDVEKICDAGLGVIAARLAPLVNLIEAGPEARAAYPGGMLALMAGGHFGSARIDDVREPILQGLIGGGLTSTEAGALVRAVFDETLAAGQPVLLQFGYLAFEIVEQAMIGLADEPLGEKTATSPAEARRRSRTARPASPTSTPPPP